MNAMIAELLEHERITNTDIKKESVDIKKMIISAFEDLKTDNSVLDFQTGLPNVYADRGLIRHVVINLISNALKFSANRDISRIIVGCRRENNEYVFYMKDNGIGIDMEYAGRLFNVFERLHSADEFKGYGIGLASVRNIVAKHGGRTWINGKVNVGTTVYFTLPIESEEGA
jgi:light-regulated signal transduction histidine kinase (bacteriophytochrome)